MQQRLSQLLGIGLLITHLLVMPSGGTAAQEPKAGQSSAAVQAKPLAPLDLADLIPQEAELSVRFADLGRKLGAGVDLSAAENRLAEIAADLKENAAQRE